MRVEDGLFVTKAVKSKGLKVFRRNSNTRTVDPGVAGSSPVGLAEVCVQEVCVQEPTE